MMKILFLGSRKNRIIDFFEKLEYEIIKEDKRLSLEDIQKINPDFIISFNYKYKIKPDVIEKYPKIINLHIAYLPWNGGSYPNFWSWLENTPKGVSIHYMDEEIDTGEMLLRKQVEFSENETLLSSWEKLMKELEDLFIENWDDILNERIEPKKHRKAKTN